MVISYKVPPVLNIKCSTQRLGIYNLGPIISKSLLKYLHSDIWDSILYSSICLDIYIPLYKHVNANDLNKNNNVTIIFNTNKLAWDYGILSHLKSPKSILSALSLQGN